MTLGRQQGLGGGDREGALADLPLGQQREVSASIQIIFQSYLDQFAPQPTSTRNPLSVGNQGPWASRYPSPTHAAPEAWS